MKKDKLMLWFMMVLWLPMSMSCEETEMEAGSIVSLNSIPSLNRYDNLPLIGTAWKLIGFADAHKSTIKIAEPAEGDCYTLLFNEDGTIDGVTSTNKIFGKYEVMKGRNIIIKEFGGTKINELFDGPTDIENLLNTKSYSITEKGLALYHDGNRKYLLYKSLDYILLK